MNSSRLILPIVYISLLVSILHRCFRCQEYIFVSYWFLGLLHRRCRIIWRLHLWCSDFGGFWNVNELYSACEKMSIHAATESDSSCYVYISNRPAHRSPNSEHDKLLAKSLQFQNCARLAGFCGESPSPTDEFERWVTIFSILVHWLQFKRGERFFGTKYHRSSAIVTAIIWKECCHDIWLQTPQKLCLCCSPNFISKFTTKVVAFNVVYR